MSKSKILKSWLSFPAMIIGLANIIASFFIMSGINQCYTSQTCVIIRNYNRAILLLGSFLFFTGLAYEICVYNCFRGALRGKMHIVIIYILLIITFLINTILFTAISVISDNLVEQNNIQLVSGIFSGVSGLGMLIYITLFAMHIFGVHSGDDDDDDDDSEESLAQSKKALKKRRKKLRSLRDKENMDCHNLASLLEGNEDVVCGNLTTNEKTQKQFKKCVTTFPDEFGDSKCDRHLKDLEQTRSRRHQIKKATDEYETQRLIQTAIKEVDDRYKLEAQSLAAQSLAERLAAAGDTPVSGGQGTRSNPLGAPQKQQSIKMKSQGDPPTVVQQLFPHTPTTTPHTPTTTSIHTSTSKITTEPPSKKDGTWV